MLSSRRHPYYVLLAIAIDALAIMAGFFLAYKFRFSGLVLSTSKGVPEFQAYGRAMAVVLPLFLFIFRSYRLYQPERHIRRIYELMNIVKAITVGAVCLMALTFIYREFSYSRMVLLSAWLFTALFCSIGRYFLIQLEYFIRRNKDRNRVLIVGLNQNARNLIIWTKEHPHYGHDIVGVLVDNENVSEKQFEGIDIVGGLLEFEKVVSDHRIDEVILTEPSIPRETATTLMLKCEDKMINFKLVADFYGLMTHYVDVEYVSNVPLLGFKNLPLDDMWNRIAKRSFDFSSSFIMLLLLSPFLSVIAFIIKCSDGGSIFYTQERVGRDGKRFILFKFRTMCPDAESRTGPVMTQKNDARITFIGALLRRTNLDELPQLWNVLVGDMSLVGPRPERPHFVEQLRGQIPRYMSRHKIKSGLTGWAQIHGLRGNTSLEERIKYDLYYMENWTLMMDIEILFATIFAYKNAY